MTRDELTPSEKWLFDNPSISSTPVIYSDRCFICRDPDFAMMGMPLCYPCKFCGGHVAADDTECDDCNQDQREA